MDIPLRIAIAGGGKMARHHAKAIGRSSVPAEVVAVAEPDPEGREQLQSLLPEVDTYSDLGSLLDRAGVDVVHVCTPPSTHVSLALQALDADCHVYVEKPFASSVSEAREVLGRAEARGLKVACGHQILFQRAARRARELRADMGELMHVESYFSFRPSRGRGDGAPPLRADEQLLDVLPHPVYLLLDALVEDRELAGRPEFVDASRGPGGTVHAQIGVGTRTGHLVVTLEGRPVESYLRLVGTHGSVLADFVRDTVQHQIGPGASTIDKILSPYRTARQLLTGTTGALLGRLVGKSRGYPGLTEAIEAFHGSILESSPAPLSADHLLGTVAVCEEIADVVRAGPTRRDDSPAGGSVGAAVASVDGTVAVTGGTGFLGDAAVARLTERGVPVRAIARRLPAPWSRRPEVDYRAEDLGGEPGPEVLEGVEYVIHCAAETSGGWEAHRRNSIGATENVIRLAHAVGASGVVHVSSVAVLDEAEGGSLDERSDYRSDPRSSGPYVWGKLASERRARELSQELGLPVKVVRPGAIVDLDDFDPPGRLGRRIGNLYLAIGGRDEPLDVVSLQLAAETLARIATGFEEAPDLLNLVAPNPLTRGDAIERLQRTDSTVRVVRLPRPLFGLLAGTAVLAQKVLRPGSAPVDPVAAFSSRTYDTERLESFLKHSGDSSSLSGEDRSAPDRTASTSAVLP